MKYVLSIFAIATVLSACTYNAKDEAAIKQQAITAVRDSLKLDSFRRAEARQKEEAQVAARVKEESRIRAEKRTLLLAEQNEAAPAPRQYSSETPAATTTQKKGWSSAAKGTVIGAGAGALGGVLLDKKNGRGAIIGGLVGAGTGYLIGRDQDKKSGRVKPKN